MNGYVYVVKGFDETLVFSTAEKAIVWLRDFLKKENGEILNEEPQENGDLMIVYEWLDADGGYVTIIQKCKVL